MPALGSHRTNQNIGCFKTTAVGRKQLDKSSGFHNHIYKKQDVMTDTSALQNLKLTYSIRISLYKYAALLFWNGRRQSQ